MFIYFFNQLINYYYVMFQINSFLKFVRQGLRVWILVPACVSFLLCSCEETNTGWDPGKPPTVSNFYPQTGKFLDRVMLVGENFPTDVNQVKVYFNARRAPITGSSGTHMTALAPRLPGGEEVEVPLSKNRHRKCIISVVVGKDSVSFVGDFIYEESTSSITIAGNGSCAELVTGSLKDAVLQPTYLCADKFGNVFVCNRGDGAFGRGSDNGNCGSGRNALLRLNEEEDIIEQVGGQTSNAPAADPTTGLIMVPTEQFRESYYTADPLEGWITRTKTYTWTHDTGLPPNGWKHCMALNPDDGYIYTWYRTSPGYLVKIQPELGEATVIYTHGSGDTDCFGLTFREGEANILYLTFTNNGSSSRSHGIYTMDVSSDEPGETFMRINAEGQGHRDGPLSTAMFNCPMQLFKDPDGFLYIADRDNHCIRRITPDNMVETVLGMPGNPGYQDGSKETALFRFPCGIAVTPDGTVYVADGGNNRIRKISIN